MKKLIDETDFMKRAEQAKGKPIEELPKILLKAIKTAEDDKVWCFSSFTDIEMMFDKLNALIKHHNQEHHE